MAYLKQRGNTWYACWKVSGTKIIKSTGIKVSASGTPSAKAKKLAQVTADAMEQAATGGVALAAALDAVRSAAEMAGMSRTLPSIRDYLLSFIPSSSSSNRANSTRALHRFVVCLGADALKRVDCVSQMMARDFVRSELKRVSISTVETYRSHLSAAFNAAIRSDMLRRNPFDGVTVSKEATAIGLADESNVPKREPFSPAEIGFMVKTFSAPWCDMVLVSFLTGGQRLGDVACLKWAAVDFDKGVVRFRTQKTGGAIVAPMVPALLDCLTRLHDMFEDVDFVFPSMAAKYRRTSTISSEFTAMVKAAGMTGDSRVILSGDRRAISPKSFHSIRHSVVSMLRSDNAFTPDLTRAIVGHDSEEIERGYYSAPEDKKRAGLDFLSQQAGLE